MGLEHPNRYGPIDPMALAHLEAWLGAAFPDDYRVFLLNANGGVPVPGRFPGGCVDCFLALHDQVWDEESPGGPHAYPLQAAILEWADTLPERDDVPIGRSGDGGWITLALEGDGRGSVLLADPESDEPARLLAGSFSEFLHLLDVDGAEEAP